MKREKRKNRSTAGGSFARVMIVLVCLTLLLFGSVGGTVDSAYAGNKMHWAPCLTGGGACLDGINARSCTAAITTNCLTDGDGAIVVTNESGSPQTYLYYLKDYDSAPPAESTPSVIVPDYNANNKRWILAKATAGGLPTYSTIATSGLYSDLSGLSANAMSFLGGANYSAMRTLLGVAIGTNVQAYSANLTTFAGIAPSANVQSLLGAADYAAMRTALSLVPGTDVQAYSANLATFAGIAPSANAQTLLGHTFAEMLTDIGAAASGHNHTGTYQPAAANLTTFAGIAPAANVQSLLGASDYAGMRTLLGLVIGTNVQAYSANLTTFAGIAPAANVVSLLSAADYAAIRTLLGVFAANGITTDSSGNLNLPSGACVQISGTSVLCGGTDGGYYIEVGNNTSYSGAAGHYRFLFLNGAPTVDVNGVIKTLAYKDIVERIGATFDGGGSSIPLNKVAYLHVPFSATINEWTVLCDQDVGASGIAVTIYKDPYSQDTLPTTDIVSTGTAPNVASGSHKTGQGSTFTGWTTTSISAGDMLGFKVTTAPTSATWCTVSLKVTR